jgi:multiple RNA-binding domain-containing protein 1
MQGYNLDDHSLLLKFSTGGAGKKKEELQQATPGKQKIGTKLMIRNIPFEATKREVRALFAPFAQV